MASIRKFIVAIVGTLTSALLLHYGHSDPLVNDIILAATALGVYLTPNEPR